MPRYIDADSVIERIQNALKKNDNFAVDNGPAYLHYKYILGLLNRTPTADVQEVRRGKHKYHDTPAGKIPYCSECGRSFKENINFCPNCGAKMEKE